MGSERSGPDGALEWLIHLSWGKEARLAAPSVSHRTGGDVHHKGAQPCVGAQPWRCSGAGWLQRAPGAFCCALMSHVQSPGAT